MDTLEIGAQQTSRTLPSAPMLTPKPAPAPALAPDHARPGRVCSRHLALDTCFGPVGGPGGKLIHTRSFPHARRVALFAGLSKDVAHSALNTLDSLDEELTANDLWSAFIKSAWRHLEVAGAKDRPRINAAICVFREAGRVEWFTSDHAAVLRAPTFSRYSSASASKALARATGTHATSSTLQLDHGETLLAWCGAPVPEAELIDYLNQRSAKQNPAFPTKSSGCFLMAERVA